MREATLEDCHYLAPRLREADKEETLARFGVTPERALVSSWALSDECYVGTYDGTPWVIWGVGGEGCVWMVGTDEIIKHRKTFMQQARWWFDHWTFKYGRLTNAVDYRNTVHRRWLERLGCEWIDVLPVTEANPHIFIVFERLPCACLNRP